MRRFLTIHLHKPFLIFLFIFSFYVKSNAQYSFGTSGLLHMPTAEMNKDKTFMFGVSALDVNTLSHYWTRSNYNPFTYNYYINITYFPWLEVAYTCTLVKGLPGSNYWPKKTWGKFVNQDRYFSAKLRLWEEGKWKEWTPQIVIGTNDPGSHNGNGGGDISLNDERGTHRYFTRFYIAATKHIQFIKKGELGIHISFIQGKAQKMKQYTNIAIGTNYRFNLDNDCTYKKILNGLNLIAEYDALTFNVGGKYSLWNDQINMIAELNNGKYFNAGLQFKVHLK